MRAGRPRSGEQDIELVPVSDRGLALSVHGLNRPLPGGRL